MQFDCSRLFWGGVVHDRKAFQAITTRKGQTYSYQSKNRDSELECLVPLGALLVIGRAVLPGGVDPLSDSNVEMDWSTFAGEYSEIYEAIIRQRCINDGLGADEKTLAKYFRLHLNRGINHYSTRDVLKNCSDLLKSALPKEES